MASLDMIPKKELVDLLRECREQFAFYGRQHRAKVPGLERLAGSKDQIADTERKAAVNEAMAAKIDALIGAPEAVR